MAWTDDEILSLARRHLTLADGTEDVLAFARELLRSERARCVDILEAEIERGRGLLGLQDMRGREIFNDEVTLACMEAIDYCAKTLKKD